jgi:hypothetical protein
MQHARRRDAARQLGDTFQATGGTQRQPTRNTSNTGYQYIIPLRALLLSDASPAEIRRRLRLNVAIRILLDALAEWEVRP